MFQVFTDAMMIATGMSHFDKSRNEPSRPAIDAVRKDRHLGNLKSRNQVK